jgi:cellulose biosynthesis protein BcsQ
MSSSSTPESENKITIKDFEDFELYVQAYFRSKGYKVDKAKTNQKGYDLVIKNDNQLIAVQVKWWTKKMSCPPLQQFESFLETEEGQQFNNGIFITLSGYSPQAIALINSWGKKSKIICGTLQNDKITWVTGKPADPPPLSKKVYMGVFTCKGGVGKTTVAAHLAGALVLQGYDIALVDLDPEGNLSRLVGDGLYLANPGRVGNTIEVFEKESWHEDSVPNSNIVVCDCSPALERNPEELIKRLDYCIIPTTLNPLGINKHAKVIKDTVAKIREINQEAHLFVLVNNFKQGISKSRYKLLRDKIMESYQEISAEDKRFHIIDPDKVHIRSSDQLYYWGIHLLEDEQATKSQLAFNLVGGRCYPRDDFIKLSEYIAEAANFGSLP